MCINASMCEGVKTLCKHPVALHIHKALWMWRKAHICDGWKQSAWLWRSLVDSHWKSGWRHWGCKAETKDKAKSSLACAEEIFLAEEQFLVSHTNFRWTAWIRIDLVVKHPRWFGLNTVEPWKTERESFISKVNPFIRQGTFKPLLMHYNEVCNRLA